MASHGVTVRYVINIRRLCNDYNLIVTALWICYLLSVVVKQCYGDIETIPLWEGKNCCKEIDFSCVCGQCLQSHQHQQALLGILQMFKGVPIASKGMSIFKY